MENKFWENFKKLAGGLTVSFSVFFLLLAISFFKDNPNLVTTSLRQATKDSAPTNSTPAANPSNSSTISGKFNVESQGNAIYSYGDGKLYHYKTVKDSSFIGLEKAPRLMLETKNEQGKIVWQNIEVSWMDSQQGILFFHFKTVMEDGSEIKTQNFTGNYQVILE